MAIYLDQQTRPVLKRIIKKWQEAHPKDFVADRIMGSIITDEKRLEEIAFCQHTIARYVGKKTCCSKCGAYYNPGMGFDWHSGDLSGSSPPPVATESHVKQDRGEKQDLTDTSGGIGPRQ